MRYILLLWAMLLMSCSTMPPKKKLNTQITKVFVIDLKNALKYPKTTTSFIDAVNIWAEQVPVHFILTNDQNVMVIRVVFGDLSGLPGTLKTSLGVYYPGSDERVVIDDDLENNDLASFYGSMRTSVCVHEIGHALGLPHVVGPQDTCHNDLVVNDAPIHIMYPAMIPELSQRITDVEINFLREKLLLGEEVWNTKGDVILRPVEANNAIIGNSRNTYSRERWGLEYLGIICQLRNSKSKPEANAVLCPSERPGR